LNEAGLRDEAAYVKESILDEPPDGPAAMLGLSAALAERGFGLEAVRLGWKAHARLRGEWSESVLRAIYPLAFADLIQAESRDRDLPPYLVAAIARQESAFAPAVVSRAGARGLLQIMPETGRWWANRLGIRDYSLDALFHPEINVHLGVAYFADLQRHYGDLQLSLIAYNAGATRARRWRERPSYKIDPELFAEQIPFSETRTYVRNIQTQLQIYRHLYADLSASNPTD
jgi:soluble lytic murein transglycosylase